MFPTTSEYVALHLAIGMYFGWVYIYLSTLRCCTVRSGSDVLAHTLSLARVHFSDIWPQCNVEQVKIERILSFHFYRLLYKFM